MAEEHPESDNFDVIVIGSGAAGLTAALALAETKRVLVLAKGSLTGAAEDADQGDGAGNNNATSIPMTPTTTISSSRVNPL